MGYQTMRKLSGIFEQCGDPLLPSLPLVRLYPSEPFRAGWCTKTEALSKDGKKGYLIEIVCSAPVGKLVHQFGKPRPIESEGGLSTGLSVLRVPTKRSLT